MLRKSQRLNSRQLDEIMKKGRVVHSPLFMARIFAGGLGEDKIARLSAVAPVKVAKTSAERHLVRRRMYEAARPLIGKLKAGTRVVLIAKAAALSSKPAEMAPGMESLFVKAGVMR